MPEYLSPGVYVEEVNSGPKPIEGAGTAMACFIGFTEKAQLARDIDGEIITEELLNKPQLITNWTQYAERFGDIIKGAHLPQSVYGYFQNGGTRCYVVSVKTIPRAQTTLLGEDGQPYLTVRAKEAGFDGLRMRVKVDRPALPETSSAKDDKKSGKDAGEKSEDGGAGGSDSGGSSIPVEAGSFSPPFNLTVERQGQTGSWQTLEVVRDVRLKQTQTETEGELLMEVAYRNDKMPRFVEFVLPEEAVDLAVVSPKTQEQSFAIQEALIEPAEYSDFQGDVMARSGVEGLAQFDDITMVCVPDLMTTMPNQKLDLEMVKAVQTMLIAHCEQLGDRVALLDSPPNMTPQEIKKWRMDTAGFDSSYAALYYPWIEVMDPVSNKPALIPPSGHLAGVWARNDNERGVHKAPANEVIRGVTNLGYHTTKGEQDTLNPNGVNCIRAFPGMGYRIWGARTLSSDPAWRYINVRRLFNYVEKSIQLGTMWTVFEPNDQRLWARVRRDVSNFLAGCYRDGMLFGASPTQSYYVKCDEELNPSESRDLGRLIVEIGIAPVKPAEFVIFRISQWAGE